MLLSKTTETIWHNNNKNYYISKGYVFTKIGDTFEVNISDLLKNSSAIIDVMCDNFGCNKTKSVKYVDYTSRRNCDNDKYYCRGCQTFEANKQKHKRVYTKDSTSFEEFCLENNKSSVLNRWDYDLNNVLPKDVPSKTNKKYYFKCPHGVHKSEEKSIFNLSNGRTEDIYCLQCNSFAQFGVEMIGNDFLKKYWDYEKNICDPWVIPKKTNKKLWIKCQNKNYHDSYLVSGLNFFAGCRCPSCSGKKLNKKDSLGQFIIDTFGKDFLETVWSNKNTGSPYDYTVMNGNFVWWKCQNGEHKDYLRKIEHATVADYRCPSCGFSRGENSIENSLRSLGLVESLDFDRQKSYDGLLGELGGLLSYDFFLRDFNLLIEYQGQYHDGSIHKLTPKYQTLKMLNKQLEHDRRKREYAKNNGIKLLEIWYWDFDKIQDILTKELKLERK